MSYKHLLVCLAFFLFIVPSFSAAVPVHDPSVIVVYKDANNNTFAENDANGTRTKYYYIFGTMLGAAYSIDMINWTPFTPTMNHNGSVSTDYYQIFKDEADYAQHYDSETVQGNLWAPDIIYNKAMGKWCLYFSLSGHDFKSTVILLTADHVEGPYTKQGVVVCSGFTNNDNDLGRQDYNKVMGTSNIPARYLNNGEWFNDYGVSCIDPSVLYDENGNLWMNYGSWSGGVFMLKLDENTGFRDDNYNYGYGSNPSWDGNRLRYDPYLGVHIAGGYYVSGEGPYIEYIENEDGVGYYYLFISMGFYSPEGGYTMRVYRSESVAGIYTDVTGNDAVFDRWIFNYGSNTTYGFPIMQNYKWNWWPDGYAEIATGHNSVLQEEDGSTYLVYHRKFDNGTAWHNVEVHQLFHNELGWPLSAPFEYRENYGLEDKVYDAYDIAGLYGVIDHAPVDYENLASNREQQIYLTASGTIQGAYTGTWTYDYANGQQFITLNTNAGTFHGVVLDQLMNDISSRTICFTAMNPANERALWGYRYTNTKTTNSTIHNGGSHVIGATDYSLAWDDFDQFHAEQVLGDFEVEFTFDNYTEAVENWHNWSLILETGSEQWYLRADAFSISTFSGSTVNYGYDWDWDTEFKEVFKDKEVQVTVQKVGTVINVFAKVEGEIIYTASTTKAPAGDYTVYLGGEATYMKVKKVSNTNIGVRQLVGTINDDGTYTSGFNVEQGQTTTVSGDFELHYSFNNYHNAPSNDNWDNFILKAESNGQTSMLRADAFMLDPVGTVSHEYDWDWQNFLEIMSGAYVDLSIVREGNVITYNFEITTRDGNIYHHEVVNTNTSTAAITYNFTVEEAMVDLIEVAQVNRVGTDCNGVEGGSAYFDNCGTCVGGNTNVEPCVQDCNGDWGGTAYVDTCEVCVAGNTGFLACSGSLEAETACTLDGTVDNNNAGFSGAGFANTTNVLDAYASWNLNSTTNQTATITFRYANGGASSRDGEIFVNGVSVGSLILAPTGAWDTWSNSTLNLDLSAGTNEILVAATTADGLANLDLIYFSSDVTDAQCGTITNVAVENNTLLLVYPNPVRDRLYLTKSVDWQLETISGELISTGSGSIINTSAYASGLYILKTQGEIFKIIKE